MKPYRESLLATRKSLSEYRESLEALPENIRGIQGRIAEIIIYPIKSLGGISVEKAEIQSTGLSIFETPFRDRQAMLALRSSGKKRGKSYDYKRFSQREEPQLSRITLGYAGGQNLSLHSSGQGSSSLMAIGGASFVHRHTEASRILMNSEGEIAEGAAESGALTNWIRSALAKLAPEADYDVNNLELMLPFEESISKDADTIYSDGGQILVTSAATLRWVNHLLKTEYGDQYRKIFMKAFRPNIVLDGPGGHPDALPANIEDLIQVLTIGGPGESVEMILTSLCVRCPVTQVESVSGARPDKEPLRILKKRPARPGAAKKAVTFGVNAAFPASMWGKSISRGDRFVIAGEKGLAESR